MTEASEGAVGKEVVNIIKPGDVGKWVHSQWTGTKWEPWAGEPFMKGNQVDLPTLLRANEQGQYPRKTASSSSRTTLCRGEDQLRWDGRIRAGGLEGGGRHGPDVHQNTAGSQATRAGRG